MKTYTFSNIIKQQEKTSLFLLMQIYKFFLSGNILKDAVGLAKTAIRVKIDLSVKRGPKDMSVFVQHPVFNTFSMPTEFKYCKILFKNRPGSRMQKV